MKNYSAIKVPRVQLILPSRNRFSCPLDWDINRELGVITARTLQREQLKLQKQKQDEEHDALLSSRFVVPKTITTKKDDLQKLAQAFFVTELSHTEETLNQINTKLMNESNIYQEDIQRKEIYDNISDRNQQYYLNVRSQLGLPNSKLRPRRYSVPSMKVVGLTLNQLNNAQSHEGLTHLPSSVFREKLIQNINETLSCIQETNELIVSQVTQADFD